MKSPVQKACMNPKIDEIIQKKHIKWILLGLLVLIFLAILILVVLYAIACNVGYVYTLLIDAGSTSSKLTVFKWKDWPFQKNGYVEEVKMAKVQPGISAYKDKSADAFAALEPHIMNLLGQTIPAESRHSTRVFLAATAGMRLLTLENPLQSEAVIESLQLQLPQVGLMVDNPYSDVRIMSGRDEGIYSWITVNYLTKKLGSRNVPPVDEKQTIGALDLGGASTQITFVPENNKPAPHTSTRNLFGKAFNLYSYSYLCYGKSAAEKRIWAEIIGNQSAREIDNPCFHQGNMVVVKTSKIFAEQCVSSKYADVLVGSALFPHKISASTSPDSWSFVSLYCFDGVYIDALLSHFGFNTSDSWRSITFSAKIDGITVSWAPGYAIDATGMIESTSPKIDLGLLAFATSVAVLSVVMGGMKQPVFAISIECAILEGVQRHAWLGAVLERKRLGGQYVIALVRTLPVQTAFTYVGTDAQMNIGLLPASVRYLSPSPDRKQTTPNLRNL
ncbi:Ectonucleoside triphosphate diphosphohydrolase [Echinococcus granulosus]|uniref:Ectonucleoside triphosphate diphosphohydrolase n=2 Tax=Echinococcus granulosus TaxID=6210 RepID=W6UPY5_ECHGR|nr:Ectonucleoside triphosphate diphosphohydrolase [Echinococcus granulosus]EUB63720.1 Ectonucleoside triphosphate diphosphohydrolase [Echinococcus granulosus]